jgi:hypothetical protein
VVTSIKQSLVFKGHPFLVVPYEISCELKTSGCHSDVIMHQNILELLYTNVQFNEEV